MEKAQVEQIAALICGLELAIVHVAKISAQAAGMSMNDLYESFIETAVMVPDDANNREQVQMVLRHIAGAILQQQPAQ